MDILKLSLFLYLTGLTLASAAHLARSYHHLFPVELFKELQVSESDDKYEKHKIITKIDLFFKTIFSSF